MGGAAASVLDQRKLGEGVRTAVGKRLKFRGGQTLWLAGPQWLRGAWSSSSRRMECVGDPVTDA